MKKLLAIITLALPLFAAAQTDSGMEFSVEGTHKFSKNLSASIGAEIRTRDNFSAWDRGTLSLDAAYKLNSNLKISAGYSFLYDQNEEKITYNEEETPNTWRPSYFGHRHRFNVSLTGNVDIGKFNVSLRERWQYTLKPETTRQRYDFDEEEWEDKTIRCKAKNVLRSRLQIEYNIRKCPITPFVSAELYNSMNLEKEKFVAGIEWKINKKQSLDAFYRYQTNSEDDEEPNRHIIGVGYNIKF